MLPTFVLATVALGLVAALIAMGSSAALLGSFVCFLVFEFCVGIYFPVVGTLKSEVVPEHCRATVYNLYRVPLNAIVCGLLLSKISLSMSFSICAGLLMVATLGLLPMMMVSPASK